LKENAVK